jgi:hypothetical protein
MSDCEQVDLASFRYRSALFGSGPADIWVQDLDHSRVCFGYILSRLDSGAGGEEGLCRFHSMAEPRPMRDRYRRVIKP